MFFEVFWPSKQSKYGDCWDLNSHHLKVYDYWIHKSSKSQGWTIPPTTKKLKMKPWYICSTHFLVAFGSNGSSIYVYYFFKNVVFQDSKCRLQLQTPTIATCGTVLIHMYFKDEKHQPKCKCYLVGSPES